MQNNHLLIYNTVFINTKIQDSQRQRQLELLGVLILMNVHLEQIFVTEVVSQWLALIHQVRLTLKQTWLWISTSYIKVDMNVPLTRLLLQVVTLVIFGIGILNWLIEWVTKQQIMETLGQQIKWILLIILMVHLSQPQHQSVDLEHLMLRVSIKSVFKPKYSSIRILFIH